jgi:hypothetical protein
MTLSLRFGSGAVQVSDYPKGLSVVTLIVNFIGFSCPLPDLRQLILRHTRI